MGMNKNDATSFEEMAEEQAVAETAVEATETTEVVESACDCSDCDCKETPKAE
jgi:hypothetical protein